MKIVTIEKKENEEFLRQPTKEVNFKKEDTKKLKKLVKDMRRKMHDADGIGLSANQIGLDKKLFVAQIPDEQGKPKFYAVINPEITKMSKETITLEEGCLSIPGSYGPVERAEKITLEGYGIDGKKLKLKAWGILARVFQHEVDHLNGTLFVDKATDVKSSE
ncbi:MAG: peptide deformylase [Candidatus Paceibacterota bacterium]